MCPRYYAMDQLFGGRQNINPANIFESKIASYAEDGEEDGADDGSNEEEEEEDDDDDDDDDER